MQNLIAFQNLHGQVHYYFDDELNGQPIRRLLKMKTVDKLH